MNGFLTTFAEPDADLQTPMDVAVVMPTVLRPSIVTALRSIFAQSLRDRIQVLIGVDAPQETPDLIAQACIGRPPNVTVQLFYPGYSTSVRHGGLCPARDGGVLRTVLSQLANSPYIAYLDDDNWWAPTHLEHLLAALREAGPDAAFAYSYRWFVHPGSLRPVCVDQWESVGPGQGVFRERWNGFIDPNCLLLDKRICPLALPLWMVPLPGDAKAMSADRTVFDYLQRHHRGGTSGQASCFYRLDPEDGRHADRMAVFGADYERAGRLMPA